MLIPLLFMGDVVGRLFREFAITLAVSILISLVVSLTLTPMMCARLLRHQHVSEQGWFIEQQRRDPRRHGRRLRRLLRSCSAIRRSRCVVAARHARADGGALRHRAQGVLPVQDTGAIQVITEAPQSVSFPAMAERQQALARLILEDEASPSLSSFIGIDGINATLNSGRMLITLMSREDARRRATEVIAAAAARGSQAVPGITLYMQPVQDLTIEDRVSRTQFQFTLEDPNADRAERVGAEADRSAEAARRNWPTSPATSRTAGCRPSSTSTATPPAALASASRRSTTRSTTLLASATSRRSYTQANQYRVVLEVGAACHLGPEALGAD